MSTMKVNVPGLTREVNHLQEIFSNINIAFKDIKSVVDKSQKYWQGDVSDKHMTMFEDIEKNYSVLYKEMCEIPKDINIMIGNYEQVEKNLQEAVVTLPTDIMN